MTSTSMIIQKKLKLTDSLMRTSTPVYYMFIHTQCHLDLGMRIVLKIPPTQILSSLTTCSILHLIFIHS
jgi:hypothetical protein